VFGAFMVVLWGWATFMRRHAAFITRRNEE